MGLLKNMIKRGFSRLGYQIVPLPMWSQTRRANAQAGYKLVDWTNVQGEVDLQSYRREQEKGNRAKINQVWTSEPNLKYLCQWLRERGLAPDFILCHGTRNGFEQRIFNEFFGCEVLGTEISSTASQFPMTVRHDFHEQNPQWDAKAGLVYSNSLDHAYDPAKALRAWGSAVKNGGFLVLEKASDSDPRGVSDLDPFGIELPNLVVFLLETLGESASVQALIDVPYPKEGTTYHKLIVVGIDRRREQIAS